MQIQCPSCNQALDTPDALAGQVVKCPDCGGQMQVPAAAGQTPGPSASAEERRCPHCAEAIRPEAIKCPHCQQFLDGPDWERRAEIGFWPAALGTMKGVLFSPARTFERARLDGPWVAMTFCMAAAAVGGAGMVLWQMLIRAAKGLGPEAGAGMAIGVIGGVLILVPLFLFVMAGMIHLMLSIQKAASEPYSVTLRAVAYSFGGTYVLLAVPVCGSLVNTVWGTVACVFAIAKMHRISYGKAAAAVLIPLGVLAVGAVVVGIMGAMDERG